MSRARLASASLLVLALLALTAVPAAAAVSARTAGLSVTVDAPSFLAKGERPVVTVTLANDSGRDAFLVRWQTPFTGVLGKIFDVRRDGQPVDFIGALYKFRAPTADDYVLLPAGASRSVRVDLSRYYDFSRTGEYTVQYRVALQDALRDAAPAAIEPFAELRSNVTGMGVERDDRAADFRASLRTLPGKAGNNAFVRCTTSQQSDLVTARGNAHVIASNSVNYLNGHTTSTAGPRYTTWFGTITTSRYATVSSQYPAIDGVFSNADMTFDCKCKQKNTYAYVYPDKPYEIHLCGAFWVAPAMGTDSKAGTLVHETSHFNVVASTDDWAYGQSACRSLAASDPDKAIDNADSHEYFAENTPSQN
jgi:peptidyl-Lys metalloendopeptidase